MGVWRAFVERPHRAAGNTPRPASTSVGRRARTLANWLWWLTPVLIIGGAGVQMPQPSMPGFESGWNMALSWAHRHGVQFGRELTFTYGPLGYLSVPIVGGEPPLSRLLWEVPGKFLLAAVLVWLTAGIPRWRQVGLWMLFVTAAIMFPETLLLVAIALITLRWLLAARPRSSQLVVAGVLFGLFGLIKFTCFLAAGACGAIGIAWIVLSDRHWRRAPLTPAAAAITYLTIWILLGQRVGNLPDYVISSLRVANGFAAAMSINMVVDLLWRLAAGIWTAGLIGAVWLWRGSANRTGGAAALLVSLMLTYLAWRHGFMRADYHVVGFFLFTAALAMALPAALSPTPGRLTLIDLCWVLSAVAIVNGFQPIASRVPAEAFNNSATTIVFAANPSNWLAKYRTLDSRARAAGRNADLQAIVGTATLDVMGADQAEVLLSDLNYHPRPVFVGYEAYTPELLRRNIDFLRTSAPEFLLVPFAPIDRWFPPLEDSLVLAALPQIYQYEATFPGGTLLRRKPNADPLSVPRDMNGTARDPVASTSVGWNTEIPIPEANGHAVWIAIDAEPTLLGRIRNLFLQPAPINLLVTDDHGVVSRRRMIPAIAREGFIIQPLLLTRDDFNLFVQGRGAQWARSIRVVGSERWWSTLRVRFSRLENDAAVPYNPLNIYVEHGYFNAPPDSVTSPVGVEEVREAGLSALQVHAPGAVVFTPPAGATRLTGSFGLRDGSFAPGTDGDGVTFVVEGHVPGAADRTLWQRYLHPQTRAEDRGVQQFTVDLPKGLDRVVLKTEIGPAGDGRFDWSYWRAVKFEHP
jgi:hypothetical protein